MLKNRGVEQRRVVGSPALGTGGVARAASRAPLARPEPDYEVVEFPTDQYVNAKLQPPPPPPPRPPTGHPVEASCGLCGGGGARVRCAECGPRALCASCDDMYHRHPKRRNHQRQALSASQIRDERPPLPPKTVVSPPVPPPRRHKLVRERSGSMPFGLEGRRATMGHVTVSTLASSPAPPAAPADRARLTMLRHTPTVTPSHNTGSTEHRLPPHLQGKLGPSVMTPQRPPSAGAAPSLGGPAAAHFTPAWGRHTGSLHAVNFPPSPSGPVQMEAWGYPGEMMGGGDEGWGGPLRRGASVVDLGGGWGCGGWGWRSGSCAQLQHVQHVQHACPAHPPACCPNHHAQPHPPHTPHSYRRGESRTMSRAGSRAGSRAASPALSVRSRASRRAKPRSPSPSLPSSDADSESDPAPHRSHHAHHTDKDRRQVVVKRAESQYRDKVTAPHTQPEKENFVRDRFGSKENNHSREPETANIENEDSFGPVPEAANAPWQCEHCTFVNEAGTRVCAVCCRTPTAAPRVVAVPPEHDMSRLTLQDQSAPSPVDTDAPKPTHNHNSSANTNGDSTQEQKREVHSRVSTGCGPSPPRESKSRNDTNRVSTPTKELDPPQTRTTRTRHDMGVGPSPPRQINKISDGGDDTNSAVETNARSTSPHQRPQPMKHSVSSGPSPPRDNTLRPSNATSHSNTAIHRTSEGTSLLSNAFNERSNSRSNVSHTGTSPPPQSISTQTYEVPSTWERAPSRSRSRRRFRDESRRERSHSRHSLSSDTKESERSARTTGGRWEGRSPRDSSPGGDWSAEPRRAAHRLARRASHLDLHRASSLRRSSYYGSQAASPERLISSRTLSMEALAGVAGLREAERGLELARLLSEAERLGFSAAEVHAALAQNPAAPLSWLRDRWPSLVAGVRAAAVRLAPHIHVSEPEARAALARHRGAMWPALTECIERHRRQGETVGAEGGVHGRVWGSPAGVDNDAAPPTLRHDHSRAEDSSDELEAPFLEKNRDDHWKYMPLEPPQGPLLSKFEVDYANDFWNKPGSVRVDDGNLLLESFLLSEPSPINEKALVDSILADKVIPQINENKQYNEQITKQHVPPDLVSAENDFIDAYNALTRLSPLHNITKNLQHHRNIPDFDKQQSIKIHNEVYQGNTKNENAKINKQQNKPTKKLTEKKSFVSTVKALNGNGSKVHLEAKELNGNNLSNIEDIPSHSEQDAANNTSTRDTTFEQITTEDISISKDNYSAENENNRDEKSNNFSEIVDNTHKLIRQMKDEINSDIYSLDGRSMSESEVNNSSNDELSTEHESSYSESSAETNDITSDEKEDLESYDDEEQRNSEKSTKVINRTSSDENEQFEEAMDHIEEQNDTFRQTNIEILDSIARSLQNDQTFSVEVQPQKLSEPHVKPKLKKTQDINNNLYAIVNSFEEIYEQLLDSVSTDIKSATNDVNTAPYNISAASNNISTASNNSSATSNNISASNNISTAPNNITASNNSSATPNNITASNNSSTASNIITASDDISISPYKVNTSSNNIGTSNAFNTSLHDIKISSNDMSKEIIIKDSDVSSREKVDKINKSTSLNVNKYDIEMVIFAPEEITKLVIVENSHTALNAVLKETEEYLEQIESTGSTATAIKTMQKQDLANSITGANEEIENDSTATNRIALEDNLGSSIIEPPNVQIIPNTADIKSDTTSSSNSNFHEKQNDDEMEAIIHENVNSIIENQESLTFNENNNKNLSATIKSSIPKLIKLFPNGKQKNDKISPKVIASKVPVRRGSIKQHPAPTSTKSHFGNVHSGHVKQLQTRLFNPKSIKAETNSTAPKAKITTATKTTVMKASTSDTLHKKGPAPLPPSSEQANKQSSPPKEKENQFFRETCRTEDEWTDSDSEHSQVQMEKQNEEPFRPPSPPPPITLRRVSGQLVDLAEIRLLEGSPERQARMLLAEGALETWEQARLAVELVRGGADTAGALLAALQCRDLPSALAYLHQECELCATRYPEHEMVSMLRCTHRCCRECARHYFTVQITERSIVDCVCPYCKEPELENLPEDEWLEYFAHLDILLKTLLQTDTHELFQRKLRDRTLARDPNFRWCVECSSGFFVHPKHKKLRCPECKSVTCASCRKPWSANHEGLSCEKYAAWLEDNDPERSLAAVQQHLRENGLECPRCHFKYSLSRGGCMHFTCTQCKYEFCYGCGKPFKMGAQCGLSEYCARLGLHAHHPRNCLFYLRDKQPHELQTLLQMNNVSYETEGTVGAGGRCPVQLQRETPAGLVDSTCGGEVLQNHAGLCKLHYVEYLAGRARGLDPLPIMDVPELVAELRRRAIPLPDRGPWDTDPIYAGMCAEIVKEKIPLD